MDIANCFFCQQDWFLPADFLCEIYLNQLGINFFNFFKSWENNYLNGA